MMGVHSLVVSQNEVYREALLRILEGERTVRVVMPPSDFVLPMPPPGIAGKRCVVLFHLADKSMPFADYASELERRKLQPRVLLCGDVVTDDDLLYYLSRGAHGFLPSGQLRNLLVKAIDHIADGGLWMPHKVVFRFVERVVSDIGHVSRLFRVQSFLSPREQEVWSLVSQGQSNKEIANQLRITERTVKFHVTQLLSKFQLTNRRELMLRFRARDAEVALPTGA